MDRLAIRKRVRRAVELPAVPTAARVGATFDGRDRFAPAVARLALGVPLRRLGSPCTFAPRAPEPPRRTRTGATGRIEHVDRFGNLITNVPSDWAVVSTEGSGVAVGTGRRRPVRIAATYAELQRGELALLPSSFGTLEIARREGSAARTLRATAGTRVSLAFRREAPLPRKDRK